MLKPPAIQTIPPKKIPFTPISLPNVTKNGAPMLPKFDIASDMPVPVERMEVGKDSVVVSENRAKPKVFKSLLNPIKAISKDELCLVN